MDFLMVQRASAAFFLLLFLAHGCSRPVHLKYKASGPSPELLAVYEGWFGMPSHIKISYNSHDPSVVSGQIEKAKAMGLDGFVADWYSNRDPYIDQSYALLQNQASRQQFHVAMMYDETNDEDGATDVAIADFDKFHDTYLAPTAPGHEAYLTYQGRPVIFIFSHGGYTDWDKVRSHVQKWNPAPFLIQENVPGKYADAFDGFYAWINPGPKGWTANGSNWGKDYLTDFYQTMADKYPDKIIVGGAWAQMNDARASWGLNRHVDARCGQTLEDTVQLWHKFFPPDQVIPFMLIGTWNDYEEGTDIEPGIPTCPGQPVVTLQSANAPPPPAAAH